MSRFKQFFFENGHEAYASLFVAFIAVVLMLFIVSISSTQLQIGDTLKPYLLIPLNVYLIGYFLFLGIALISGFAAIALAFGKWIRFLIVVTSVIVIGFCGLTAVALGALGSNYNYETSANIQFADRSFKIIHAFHNGDMIAEADYLLLECKNNSDCTVIDKFDDYDYDASKSKSASFFVETSDNALYIKIGNEVALVARA